MTSIYAYNSIALLLNKIGNQVLPFQTICVSVQSHTPSHKSGILVTTFRHI